MQTPNFQSDTHEPIHLHSNEATSWWLWVSWNEREGSVGFIYGCAARTSRPVGWADEVSFDIPGDGRLIVSQCIITDAAFDRFKNALEAGLLDISLIIPSSVLQAHVVAMRTIIQDALGQSAIQTALYYTLPDVQALIGSGDGVLGRVLSILQEQLNFPFMKAYAGHLGNFEIFELHSWLDAQSPFLIEAVSEPSEDRSGPQIMEICRTVKYAGVSHTAHFVGRVHGEVVLDRLIPLPSNQCRVPIEVPERLDQFDFRIFSEDGQKLHHSEHASFLNRVGLIMSPVIRQMTIEDELTTKAAGKGGGLVSQASKVAVYSSQRSQIGAPAAGTWRKFVEDMEQNVATFTPTSSEDKWFPQGIEGEIGAIAHLNHILDGGKITSAVLVDPWFGAEALQRFVLRLGCQNVQLTIVTSWTDIDPDTDLKLNPAESSTKRLENALGQVSQFLNPRLTFINVVDGNNRAFHDRYLLIYPHEDTPKVFILSNSINKMAGNWPFAISLLANDVSQKVQRYIEALCKGQDDARGRSLTISFRWPSNGTV